MLPESINYLERMCFYNGLAVQCHIVVTAVKKIGQKRVAHEGFCTIIPSIHFKCLPVAVINIEQKSYVRYMGAP